MAAEAKVILTAQDATTAAFRNVERNMGSLQKQAGVTAASLKNLAGSFGLALGGTAVLNSLQRVVTQTIEFNDALANTATKTGMTVEQLSALQYAAKQADVEFSALSGALVKFNRGIAEANSGSKSSQQAFTQLGISLDTIRNTKPEQLFLLVAQRISELRSEADRTKAEIDLFGRSGSDLDPLFSQGAEGINRATAAAKELGAVISTEANQRVTELGDKADQLKSKWDAFATNLLGRSAPTIIKALDLLEKNANRPFLERLLRRLTGADIAEGIAGMAGVGEQPSGTFRGVINRGGTKPGSSLIGGETEEEKAARLAREREKQREIDYWQDIRYELNASERKFYDQMADYARDYADDTIDQIERENEARREARDNYAEWLKDQQRGTSQLSEFAAQAARNMQDAFAQFLFDPFKGGLKGMLRGFIDMLRQMVAQIAAQAILKQFFSWMAGGSGIAGTIGKALQAGLTGKAGGGNVMGRSPYLVGERGPELFVPSTSGTIVPNHRMGGGVTLAPVYNVDARGASADLVKSLPAILEANTRRAVELARATIYDDYSRGAFGRA